MEGHDEVARRHAERLGLRVVGPCGPPAAGELLRRARSAARRLRLLLGELGRAELVPHLVEVELGLIDQD